MSGRLQKVATITIVASVFSASPALAADAGNLYAIAAGSRTEPAPAPSDALLRFSRANAFENWSLTATASRRPWDPTDLSSSVSRFDSRDALDGEASRASVAFDWRRRLVASQIQAAAFASRRGIDLYSDAMRGDDASSGERFAQRERASLFGAAVGWNGGGSLGGFPSTVSTGVRVRSEALDSEGTLEMRSRQPLASVREDWLRQASAGLHLESELRIAERVRAIAGMRYDGYRFGVSSDLEGHGGARSGSLASPHVSIVVNAAPRTDLFFDLGRGLRAQDPRSPAAAIDPRNGAPLGYLDPLATLETMEAGLRARWFSGATTSVSMFRAKAPSELTLTGDTGIGEFTRPTLRQGVQLAARYDPASWLTLDLQATALRARFADGALEYIPAAAERTTSAGATLRVRNGWSASLLVSYFGRRQTVEDDSPRRKASSFVNGRLSRNLSKKTRITFDVFNVFDQRLGNVDYFSATRVWYQPGAGDNFLLNPLEPRGFRIRLRTTF